MQFSSTVWLILIGLGGLLAAVGTINFNLARDREKSVSASQKAIALLKNEISNNLLRVRNIRQLVANNQMSTQRFETAAWSVAMNGGLLTEVDKATLDSVIDIYYKVELVERYRLDILENSSGVLAALDDNSKRIKQYQGFLIGVIDQLEPQLRTFVANNP